jgi:hypothetical protein
MRIALIGLLALAGLIGASIEVRRVIADQAREGALCTGLVSKAREGEALTADERKYIKDWCSTKDPYLWDAHRSSQ